MTTINPEKIKEKFDRIMAERDTRDAWRAGPIDAPNGLKLQGHAQLFLLIPLIAFIESTHTFDEFSNVNNFACSFITMLQFTMYVLQMCAAQLNAINTPPGSYTIHVYLVPLPDVDGKTVDYMLVVDITEISKEVIDISKMFIDLAKSPTKTINMAGKLMDNTSNRNRGASILGGGGGGEMLPDGSGKSKDKYGIFREVIKDIGSYDKVLGILAQKEPSRTSTQMDPVNNLTLEAALRWAKDPSIHPTHKVDPKYCMPETFGMQRGVIGSKITLPAELLKFQLSPDYWSPSLFCKQFMPHRIPENYNTTFHQNMHVLFKETMHALKQKNRAAAAEAQAKAQAAAASVDPQFVPNSQNTPPAAAAQELTIYGAPVIADMPQFRDEYTGPDPESRDAANVHYMPTLADGVDAAGPFAVDEDQSNSDPTNPELRRIKLKLQRNREIIRDVHKAGFLSDAEMLAWQNDAVRNAIAEYGRVKKQVSTTAGNIYKYLEDNGLMEDTPEVRIIDTTKSIFDNYMAWFIEALSVYCGVAVHQITVWCLFILIGTSFDAPGQQMHACVIGDGGSGKSFSVGALFALLAKIGVIMNDTNSRGANFINARLYDSVIYHDEMDPTSLTDNGNSQIAEQKALLSNGFIQRDALMFDPETGERKIDKLMHVKSCSTIGLMNKDHMSVVNANPAEKTSMAALMTRYALFDMSSFNHFQRTVQFAKAGMNNPLIEKTIKGVVNKIVVMQRWRMETGHLMYMGALPPARMNVLTMCLTKFEKTLSDVNIKATSNRQSVNVERFCRQTTIVRCLLERFCVSGVSPYFGKPYKTEHLIGTPFVATLDDVIHATTSLYHTYVPRALTSVISLIRDLVKQATDSGDISSLIFSNPMTAPTRRGRPKKPHTSNNNNNNNNNNAAPPQAPVPPPQPAVGPAVGPTVVPAGGPAGGQAQITSLFQPVAAPALPQPAVGPPAPPAPPAAQGGDYDDDEDDGKPKSMQYIGFKDLGIDRLAQKLHTSAKILPEIPSVLAIRNCLSVLQELLIATPMYTWSPGMDIPCIDSTNDKIFNKQAVEQCGRHTFINLKIIDNTTSRFEDLWKRGVLSMCDSKTAIRSVLTGIPHRHHVWIPEEIILKPQTDMPSVVLNPNYLSKFSRLIISGSMTGGLDGPAPLASENSMDAPAGMLIDESSRAFIEYDMDIDFSAHLSWFVENGHGAIDSVQAIKFAKENQSATKIALTLGVIKAQEAANLLAPGREFISFPTDVIAALDKLKTLNDTLVDGVATNNRQTIDTNRDIIISVTEVMKGKLNPEQILAFDVAITRVDQENLRIKNNKDGISASEFAEMHGMEMQEGDTLMDLIDRQFQAKQQVLHPTMGLKRLHGDLEEDLSEDEVAPRPFRARTANIRREDPVEEVIEGIAVGAAAAEGRTAAISRACIITEPEENPRKKRKNGRRMTVTEITHEEAADEDDDDE